MEELDQRAQRIAKLDGLKASGRDPYAIERFDRLHTSVEILEGFTELEQTGFDPQLQQSLGFLTVESEEGPVTRFAGRLVTKPPMGKASFAHVQDEVGRVQIYVRRDDLGDERYDEFLDLDIGDIIGLEGFIFRTRTGEIS